jgi:E3 ubiquitin-protein ligase RAD18
MHLQSSLKMVRLSYNGSVAYRSDEAPCPLCAATMPISAIPTHIDRGCPPPKPKAGSLIVGNQKADWKKVFSGAASGKAKV